MSWTNDPGVMAQRLREASEELAEVRAAVEDACSAIPDALRQTEQRISSRQQDLARTSNRAEDLAARQANLAEAVSFEVRRVVEATDHIADALIHAEQLPGVIERRRAQWESELATRRSEADALRARRARAKPAQRPAIQSQLEAVTSRIDCAQQAVGHCREAAGIAARAGLAASRADLELDSMLTDLEAAEDGANFAADVVTTAMLRIGDAQQQRAAAADRLTFAKRAHQETDSQAASFLAQTRSIGWGLDDAAEQLLALDRGAMP
ncbi:MAG: hypothetical protein ACK5KO_04615 [Arachnia sp.]